MVREPGAPPRSLILKHGDEAVLLGRMTCPLRQLRDVADVYAVIHRGPETYTHLYLVPVRPGTRCEVLLGAVLPGADLAGARCLAQARYGLSPERASDQRLAA